MSSRMLARAAGVALLLTGAFFLGFVSQDVAASVGEVREWVAGLHLVPSKIERAQSDASTAEPLPIVETYSYVMDRLKADYYPKKIDERKTTYAAVRGMLSALGDPFTRFLTPEDYKRMREENEGNFTGIGAQLDTNKLGEVYVKEPMEESPAIKAGVKANDVIKEVDRKSIKGIEIDDVVKMIRGPEGTKVTLTLARPRVTKPVVITIVRRVVPFQMVKFRMLDEKTKIGYIRLYQFNEQSDVQFDKAMTSLENKGMKGLVVDLRGNPGGLLQVAVDIGSRFIDSGAVVWIQERKGQKTPLNVDPSKHNHKRYPMSVLVDKSSASASEIVSGGIKDVGAGTLVGVTTFGKGCVQTIIPLQDGSAVAITTAKYLTAKGNDIHKKGVTPDVEIEATEDFDPNDPETDVQLTKAVEAVKVKMGLLPATVLEPKKESEKIEVGAAGAPKKSTD